MKKPESGVGAGWVLIILVILFIAIGVGIKALSHAAPTVEMRRAITGIGQNTEVTFDVRDLKHNIKSVEVEVSQNGKSYRVPVRVTRARAPARRGWKFWAKPPEIHWNVATRVGRKEIPELQQGRATLHIVAVNDSWGRLFRGGRTDVWKELPVRFVPPAIEVLTTQHYVNQGGCDMVLFKVSPETVESGVQVGDDFFPSWPVKETLPGTRLAIFAYPWNVERSATAHLVARDDAGNQSVSSFTYVVFPKKFRAETINLTDEFIERVVPPIMSQMPDLEDQGSLLKNFLLVNGHLREVEAQQLVEMSKQTASRFLWHEPFLQLGDTKVEASFADYRTYKYNGQVVDHQTHLGFDLAGLQHMPVKAANDGVVVFAGFFGIYGNAVVIDHGCGIQSLYGHLSSIQVKQGESVRRGQQIGVSGETGLAGGDHLHFTVLLDGIPVNPVEWWDPHWIHDRLMAKLAAYQ